MNLILNTDSYKIAHYGLYPPGTESIYSYYESRGGRFHETVFFGLQHFLRKIAGAVVTRQDIAAAQQILRQHFGQDLFNAAGFELLVSRHGGKLPLLIKALPEGTVAPVKTVLFTVENTDPEFFWLTNFLESYLSQIWYPISVATLSWNIKRLVSRYMIETAGTDDGLEFKLHDFGYRGVSSNESAAIGGMAHLVNFAGTDNLVALSLAMETYHCGVVGFSIPATEHSIMTSWGGRDHEVDACANALNRYPSGMLAVVSDSYDIYKCCRDIWGTQLKDQILARDGTLVVRPDSGRPEEVVVKVLDILGGKFGYEMNDRGYKVLNPKIRVIQGDGVDLDSIELILQQMKRSDWAALNVTFGCGGALLQKSNRDTHKFAFKCSAAKVAGAWREVFKQPITDAGKTSKRGRFSVIEQGGKLKTVPELTGAAGANDRLQSVFRDGEILREWTFAEVQATVAAHGLAIE